MKLKRAAGIVWGLSYLVRRGCSSIRSSRDSRIGTRGAASQVKIHAIPFTERVMPLRKRSGILLFSHILRPNRKAGHYPALLAGPCGALDHEAGGHGGLFLSCTAKLIAFIPCFS